MRTAESIHQQLITGNFVTYPGDVFIVEASKNMLSSSITVQLMNGDENAVFGLPNNPAAWNFLKNLNEIAGRQVLYQVDGNSPIPLEQSKPYIYRFSRR